MDQQKRNRSIDEDMQVFIVRLWTERREIEGASPLLRGTVDHIPSGERRSIKDLDSLLTTFLPYLQEMGINGLENCNGKGK